MNINLINAYLERAREIIGTRSRDEIDYDDAVISNLSTGMNIKTSIASANNKGGGNALELPSHPSTSPSKAHDTP